MCTLRNISYKVDVEIDRNVYLDAIRVPIKNNDSPSVSRSINGEDDSVDSTEVSFIIYNFFFFFDFCMIKGIVRRQVASLHRQGRI